MNPLIEIVLIGIAVSTMLVLAWYGLVCLIWPEVFIRKPRDLATFTAHNTGTTIIVWKSERQ